MFVFSLQKKKGSFQHSSFLAGGATKAAGRLVVEDGTLKVNETEYSPFFIDYITMKSQDLVISILLT